MRVLRHKDLLQWSHGILAMDSTGVHFQASKDFKLQWSHGILAMDRARPTCLAGPTNCFNGAMAF